MNIRCPKCRRHFDYDPSSGLARCPYEDCDWDLDPLAETGAESPESLPEIHTHKSELTLDTSAAEPAGELVPQGETLPAVSQQPGALPKVQYIHCPVCTARIPDNVDICPACGADLLAAFQQHKGLRALFHVSGDITFSPRMVAFLFVFTLAAFLTFTWLLTGRRQADDSLARLSLVDGPGEFEGQVQGVTFSQLKSEFLDPTSTDFRKDAVRQKFLGKRVIWNGLVREVRDRDGRPLVDLVMEGPDSRSFVTLQTLENEKNRQMMTQLSRGQKVMFSGKIDKFDTGGATDAFDYFRVILAEGIILQ